MAAAESTKFLDDAAASLATKDRSELERDEQRVQLVAAAAFRHKGGYLLFERSPDDPKTERFGTYTLWHRCHVEKADAKILEAAQTQLRDRIVDDLHLSNVGRLEFLGVLWSEEPAESNHLGLAFVVDIEERGEGRPGVDVRHSDIAYVLIRLLSEGRECLLLHRHAKWGDWESCRRAR